MGERIRAFDWASHPLGPPGDWPAALKLVVNLCLSSSFPTAIYWGQDLHVLYNDAWSVIPADRHPAALGQPARELWSDIWHVVGPHFERVLATGEGVAQYEEMLPMVRHGVARETWWNYSLTAVHLPDHTIGGLFNQGNEITETVLARRLRQKEVERWRDLFRQAPAAVALLRGPDHVFEVANEAYLRLVGRPDVVGQAVRQALPEVVEQGFIELLDRVYRTGEPYVGASIKVTLQAPGAPKPQEHILDFVYQPVRDLEGAVDGIFVLVTDVTARSHAEAALRISNWQLGEERARLASIVEAEQRAQQALRRFNDTLEKHVASRTAQLTRTLETQGVMADRLRATFETSLIYQAFLDPQGKLLEANLASLQGIQARLNDVVGLPFWETPWFASTDGLQERVRAGVEAAASGRSVVQEIELDLPIGRRRFDFSLRPVLNAKGAVVGIVPQAVDITERRPTGPPSRTGEAP
ncbi:MAG: PAS domain-containing protein [Ramlibacter sp.]